jgi:hypothetical protein
VFFSSPLSVTFYIVIASVALALAWVIYDAARSMQGKPYFGQPRVTLAMLATSSSVLVFMLFYLFDPNFLESPVRENTFGCGAMSPEIAWILIGIGAGMVVAWSAVTRGWYRSRTATGTRPNSITPANVMDSDTRKRIKALVDANPGIHFSRIKGLLGMSPRTIRDQLHLLVKFGHVIPMDVDGKKSYIVQGSLPGAEISDIAAVQVLAFVQHSGRETLVESLLSDPGASFSRLCTATNEPRSTVRRKVKAMEDRGFVVVDRSGREMVSIRLAANIEQVLLRVHGTSSTASEAPAISNEHRSSRCGDPSPAN